MLKKYNLALEIEGYNKRYKTDYGFTESFGYPYLLQTILEQTHEVIDLINAGFWCGRWEHGDKSFLQKTKITFTQIMAGYKGAEKSAIPIKPPEDYEYAKQLVRKKKWYVWEENEFERLMEESTWEALFNHPSTFNRSYQREMKRRWDRYNGFARFSHQAIVQIATDILPNLIAHQRTANQQLIFAYFAMPGEIYQSYKNYLQQFFIDVEKYQEKLAESMYARLKAWDESGFKHANIILNIHQQLGKTGAKVESKKHLEEVEKFTPEQFTLFHQYIFEHGTDQLCKELKYLPWFQNATLIPIQYIVQSDGKGIFVPQGFVNDIQNISKWPRKWFVGAQLKRDFFKNRGMLLAILNNLIDVNRVEINLKRLDDIVSVLEELKDRENRVFLELKEVEKLESGFNTIFSKLFHRQAKAILMKWKICLFNYQNELLVKKLDIAEKLLFEIKKEIKVINGVKFLPCKGCFLLQTLIDNIKKNIQNRMLPEVLQLRVKELTENSLSQLASHKAYSIMVKVSGDDIPTKGEINFIASYLENLKLMSEVEFNGFIQLCDLQLNLALDRLQRELKKKSNIFSLLDEVERHVDTIITIAEVLKVFNLKDINNKLKVLIENKMQKYFLKYLEIIQQCQADSTRLKACENVLQKIEMVICTLGKEIYFNNKSLVEHIAELKKLREKPGKINFFVYAQMIYRSLAEELLEKCVEKDVSILSKNASRIVKNNECIMYDEEILSCFNRLTKRLQKKGNVTIEEVLQELSLCEKSLLGMNKNQFQSQLVTDLVNAELRAKSVEDIVHDNKRSLNKKIEGIAELVSLIKNIIAHNGGKIECGSLLVSASGKRELFTKPYLDHAILTTDCLKKGK